MTNIMFFDLETTGLPLKNNMRNFYSPSEFNNYDTSRIIEIAYIICTLNGETIKTVSKLIKPDNFTITNTHIQGITYDKALNEGEELYVVLNELYTDLQDVNTLVAHNIKFDKSVLLAECYRKSYYSIINEICKKKILCTMMMGKTFLNVNKFPKLVELYKKILNIDIDNNHRALIDTTMCKEIYFKIITNPIIN